jgi:TPR repeat protein
MYELGEGFDPHEAEAIKWYTLAAEQGRLEAQINLARIHEQNGRFDETAFWDRRAADQGYAKAQANLAYALSLGRGVAVNQTEAVHYYQLAAQQGYAPAQSNLGGMYAEGRGAPVNPAAAVHWVRLAADQGYGPAEKILSDFYAQGFGVPADNTEAMKWLVRAALRGDAAAQNALAIRYATGDGVDRDSVRAFMWFAAAALENSPVAVQNKNLVPVDRDTEICKLISAAETGDSGACRDLAIRLKDGNGIIQDGDTAGYWIFKAAERGDIWSQTTYALLLTENGHQAEGVKWLARAAEQGDERALFNLGLNQLRGTGTALAPESAAVNLLRASLSGFAEAREVIKEMRPSISEASWSSILDRVRWPDLTFILGPLVEGHLDGIRISQENDDGSDDALWLKYEREVANSTFRENEHGSLLDSMFGEPVTIKHIYVGRAYIEGKSAAAITISLRNIHLMDGFPVYWKPPKEAINAVMNMIGLLGGRAWMRWNYTMPY